MSRVLLTVSGTVPAGVRAEVEAGGRPEPDYLALADAMGADLLDVPGALARTGRLGRLLLRAGGPGPLLAWAAFRARRRYDAILTDGEQVGIPLAALARVTGRRLPAHVMIVHILSTRSKSAAMRALRLAPLVDRYLVYASAQQRFLTERFGVPADHVVLTSFMVDPRFWAAERVTPAGAPMICSAGLENRDYDTLIAAVRDLPVRVVIAAASPWSKRADGTAAADLPANVERTKLGFVDLRQLYADARFVVMPLHESPFQAGITTILEAMSMGRAVVCSRTQGQTDVLVDGVSGVYVLPGDVGALRTAIADLLADPDRATALGAGGRDYVTSVADVRVYARRLADAVERAMAERAGTR